MIELKREFDIKYESLNYLEERVCEPLWELLYQNFDKLPKEAKVEVSIKFSPSNL